MTHENNPSDDLFAASTEEGTAPARRTRARRVATSGTTTPRRRTVAGSGDGGASPAEEGAPSAEGSAVPQQAPETDAAAPAAPDGAKAPRSRARRSPKAAPAAEIPETADDVPPSDEGRPAPARAKRSRRATSSSVAPVATADEAAAPAEQESVPAAPTTRRRGSRSTAQQSPQAEEASQPDTGPSGPSSQLDVLAELGGQRAAEAEAEAPRLPATALLFQAPDPSSRPRSRRAQAPAGPPRHEVVPEEGAGEAVAEVEDEIVDETPVPPARTTGRGRRRGGRGSTDQDERQVQPVPSTGRQDDTETASGGDDASASDEADEDETDETDEQDGAQRRRRRRGGRGRRSRSGSGERGDETDDDATETDQSGRRSAPAEESTDDQDEDGDDENDDSDDGEDASGSSSRRRRRRRRGARADSPTADEPAQPSSGGRTRTRAARPASDEVTALKGSTRLEAKRQRRREGRDAGRRRTIVTESEFLARRESVERSMVVREANDRVQIAVLEDGVLVEHFVSRSAQNAQSSMAGNVYLGRVQNVLPSMEAAFVDVGKGRNAVLYAGEVNWDAAGLEGQPRRIEQALKSGDSVLVQVTKDPIGHKGARLTSQVTLAGRYLVYVPGGGMTGISRKLPEGERARLKKLLKEIVPDAAGVIVRTAAEGAAEDELRRDVQRLQEQWAVIEKKAKSASAPALLQGEPDLAIRVVRDIFNDDFSSLVVQGDGAWSMISEYVEAMAPDLAAKVSRWTQEGDVFAAHRIDEQLAKGMDRKVWLPSGGSLVIDRTEAMTVVDVNTGKFTGSGGTLEETVTRNNIEAAEEIVRQLRLRDIGGIIVIDFIDMVLESNRDLVLRRLVECLGRDRTKHQVAEVTSLGLVQMTRKRVGQGLVEAFSETCQHCNGRGFIVHSEPIEQRTSPESEAGRPSAGADGGGEKRSRRKKAPSGTASVTVPVLPEAREAVKATLATIAAAAAHAHEHEHDHDHDHDHDHGTPPAVEAELEDALTSIAAVETIEPVTTEDLGEQDEHVQDGISVEAGDESTTAATESVVDA